MSSRVAHAGLPRALSFALALLSLSSFGTITGIDVANAAPYQATAGADCGASTNCIVKFPAVPAASRVEVQFVACEIRSSGYQTVNSVRFELQTTQNGKPISLDLVSLYSGEQFDGTNDYSAISQPVVFPVSGQQSLSIIAWESSGGSYGPIDRMDCTVNGALEDAATPGPVLLSAHAQCPSGANCVVQFPTSASPLKATFAACVIYSATTEAASYSTRFYLQTSQNGKPIGFPLGSNQGAVEGPNTYPFAFYSEVGQPVNFLVPANQTLKLFAWPDSGRYIDRMDCTVAVENMP